MSTILPHLFLALHTIAPFMIIMYIGVIVWLLVMGRKWKKNDPERYNRKY